MVIKNFSIYKPWWPCHGKKRGVISEVEVLGFGLDIELRVVNFGKLQLVTTISFSTEIIYKFKVQKSLRPISHALEMAT